jgi:signal peptidase II
MARESNRECFEAIACPWRVVLLALVSTLTLLLDLGTKAAAEHALASGPVNALQVGSNRLDLALAHNPGAAFSMLHGLPEKIRVPLLATIALAASVAMVLTYRRIPAEKRLSRFALAMVLGGALGNLVDRIRAGAVVDFIRVTRGDQAWPTFNVADIAITCGGILLFLASFSRRPAAPSSVARSP